MRTTEGRGPAHRGGSRGGTQYRYRYRYRYQNRLPCRGMPRIRCKAGKRHVRRVRVASRFDPDSDPDFDPIRRPNAAVPWRYPQPRKPLVRLCLFGPEGAQSLSPGHRPGYRAHPRLSALKGRYTWRAVAMDCRYAAPAGLNLVDDSIPRAVPWAEELPRFQRSAPSGIRDTLLRRSPPRVKRPMLFTRSGGDRSRKPYATDMRSSSRRRAGPPPPRPLGAMLGL
jgi:hypothetical protein